jgi:hypothetical protein
MLKRTSLVLGVLAMLCAVWVASATASGKNVHLVGGGTNLAIAPAVVGVLTSHHISVAPIAPATARAGKANKKAVVASFPIVGGQINPKTLVGYIRHSGGLMFTKGAKSVRIGLFTIVINKHPQLTGAVNLNPATRVPVLNLDVSHIKVVKKGSLVAVLGVRVSLTKVAASALNAGLGTKVFAPGLKLGVANVFAKA